jgi:transcriptional regulator GlxA family with amidase domain
MDHQQPQWGSGKILQVAMPIFKGVTTLDFVGPYEVLNCLPNVKVVFVSHSAGLYTDFGTLSIQATASFDQVPKPDIVVVPGGIGTLALMEDETFLQWLRKVCPMSVLIPFRSWLFDQKGMNIRELQKLFVFPLIAVTG